MTLRSPLEVAQALKFMPFEASFLLFYGMVKERCLSLSPVKFSVSACRNKWVEFSAESLLGELFGVCWRRGCLVGYHPGHATSRRAGRGQLGWYVSI